MGGGGSPASTSTTSKVELPAWVEDRYKDIFGEEDKLYGAAQKIAGEMGPREILGQNDLETAGLEEALSGYDTAGNFLGAAGDFSGIDRAMGGMEGVLGGYEGYNDLAAAGQELTDYTSGRIGDGTIDDMRASYESDYTGDVVDTTLANQDAFRERERLQEMASSAARGGVSNTRSSVQQAVADQLYGMNRAQTEAKLRDEAFNTAAKFGQNEARMGMDQDQMNYDFLSGGLNFGADMLGDKLSGQQGVLADILAGEEGRQDTLQELSDDWATLGSAKGGALASYGGQQRALEQGQMDADRTHNMEMTNWLSSILGQNKSFGPSSVGTTTSEGTQQQATPGFGETLLGLGGLFLSDEDAKEDITDAADGALDDVLQWRVKEYRYREGMPGHRADRHTGLIAQDIEKTTPDAVLKAPDGLRRVDPWPVSATIVKAVQELEERDHPDRKWAKAVG